MPQAMARLRDTHNLCLPEITKFLLDLFKYNDNSRNKVTRLLGRNYCQIYVDKLQHIH